MELDDESKPLVTINTHRRPFQYQRLPFGVKSAPSIFQKLMDNLPGVHAYLDDLIIASRTLGEPFIKTIMEVFKRLQEYGLKISLEKCKFLVNNLEFLGKIVTGTEVKPNPKKTKAIIEMPPLKNTHEVRAFLGALNYYGRFIAEMRALRAPMENY